MANEKRLDTRIINKHDSEINWLKAGEAGFIPKKGEWILYDPDDNYDYFRVKIGDGETKVHELPFALVTPVELEQAIKDVVEEDLANDYLITPITYMELKQLRDKGQLIPGMFYRITDYTCTTSQTDIKVKGHQFDIIVQALSENTLSESARADYHGIDGYFIKPVVSYLKAGAVTKYYDIYEDIDGGPDNGIGDYKNADVFIAYSYLNNNDDNIVPVLYKTDIEDPELSTVVDYQDVYYYVGTYEYDGVVYDKWRKIEHDIDGGLKWDSPGKIYALTNVVVEDNAFIPDVLEDDGGAQKCANIPAWELKYCLDNDTSRFAWAASSDQCIVNLKSSLSNGAPLTRQSEFDGQNSSNAEYQFAWGVIADVEDSDSTNFIYSKNEILTNGELVYSDQYMELQSAQVVTNTGVIYWMKDEWNNECPYDFKNIVFQSPSNQDIYTFSHNDETDCSLLGAVTNSKLGYCINPYTNQLLLPYNCVFVKSIVDNLVIKNNSAQVNITIDNPNAKNILIESGIVTKTITIAEDDTAPCLIYRASGTQEIILD